VQPVHLLREFATEVVEEVLTHHISQVVELDPFYGNVATVTDGKGGLDCYSRAPKKYTGDGLRLGVNVMSSKPWAGYLSFKSFDADDRQCIVRRPLEFR
jgi:hypothetical protein